LRLQNVRR